MLSVHVAAEPSVAEAAAGLVAVAAGLTAAVVAVAVAGSAVAPVAVLHDVVAFADTPMTMGSCILGFDNSPGFEPVEVVPDKWGPGVGVVGIEVRQGVGRSHLQDKTARAGKQAEDHQARIAREGEGPGEVGTVGRIGNRLQRAAVVVDHGTGPVQRRTAGAHAMVLVVHSRHQQALVQSQDLQQDQHWIRRAKTSFESLKKSHVLPDMKSVVQTTTMAVTIAAV